MIDVVTLEDQAVRLKRRDLCLRMREDLFTGKLLEVGWLSWMRC